MMTARAVFAVALLMAATLCAALDSASFEAHCEDDCLKLFDDCKVLIRKNVDNNTISAETGDQIVKGCQKDMFTCQDDCDTPSNSTDIPDLRAETAVPVTKTTSKPIGLF